MEFLKQAIPGASTIAILGAGDPEQPLSRNVWSSLEQAAHVLNVNLRRLQVQGTVEQLDEALGALLLRADQVIE